MVLRAVTDEIMYALMKLSGQEYVDEYAQQAKSRARAGPQARAEAQAARAGAGAGGRAARRDLRSGPDGG